MYESARPATLADAEVMARLAADSVDEQRDARGGRVWSQRESRAEPSVDSLRGAVESDAIGTWVGEFDGVVVGYAVAHAEPLRDGALLAIIDDIYVDPAARGVGVGAAMMLMILPWASGAGCEGVDGLALPGNRATKNFFERFGFSARSLTVHHRLSCE
jgi:GNAT superfamily N-acetyltransferase